MNRLNLVSYNVHGLNHPIKRKKILSQLKKLQCSIALIQETHLVEGEYKKTGKGVGEPSISCFIWEDITLQKKRGVAILINKSLPFSTEKVIQDTMGR